MLSQFNSAGADEDSWCRAASPGSASNEGNSVGGRALPPLRLRVLTNPLGNLPCRHPGLVAERFLFMRGWIWPLPVRRVPLLEGADG